MHYITTTTYHIPPNAYMHTYGGMQGIGCNGVVTWCNALHA